jgi:alpha-amylase
VYLVLVKFYLVMQSISPTAADGRYLGPYQNFVPGLLDYVTYYRALRAFTRPQEMEQLYHSLVKLPEKVVDVTLLARFMENHDQPRFSGLTRDIGLRQSAFVFNILGDGIPVVSPNGITN